MWQLNREKVLKNQLDTLTKAAYSRLDLIQSQITNLRHAAKIVSFNEFKKLRKEQATLTKALNKAIIEEYGKAGKNTITDYCSPSGITFRVIKFSRT